MRPAIEGLAVWGDADMDVRAAERYIVKNCKYLEFPNYTVGKQLLHFASVWLSLPVAAYLFFGHMFVMREQVIGITQYVLIVFLPSVPTVILSVRREKRLAKDPAYESLRAPTSFAESEKWKSVCGNLGTAVILVLIFVQRQGLSMGFIMTVLMFLVSAFGAFFVDEAVPDLYALYLLKKYCPYIKYPADARYQKPREKAV